jgi:hypothetical protein
VNSVFPGVSAATNGVVSATDALLAVMVATCVAVFLSRGRTLDSGDARLVEHDASPVTPHWDSLWVSQFVRCWKTNTVSN